MIAGQREIDERAQLVVVVAARDHRQQRGRDAVAAEQIEHAQLGVGERGAEHRLVGRVAQRVERQDDARVERRQPRHQRLVLLQPEAVGRDRDAMDALGVAQLDQPREVGVQRRLAASEVDDAALGIRGADVAEDRAQLGLAHVVRAVVLVVRVTDRTVEVARAGDRHDRQHRGLLVLRARPAVERAAALDRTRRGGRPGHRGQRRDALVPVGVLSHDDLARAVDRAGLHHHHALVAALDHRGDAAQARGAQAGGVAEPHAPTVLESAVPLHFSVTDAAPGATNPCRSWADLPIPSPR